MKTKKKLFAYLTFVLFLGFAVSSCEGPVGPQGEAGLDGVDGTNGTDATNGTDGTDGANCWDTNNDGVQDAEEDINGDGVWDTLDCNGTDGTDGVDAVVAVHIFNNPTWDAGSNMVLNLPALTQEVIDTYVIAAYLGYPVDNVPNSVYYPVPGTHSGGSYFVRNWINLETYTMKAVYVDNNENAYPNPDIASSAKILLIAPTETTETDGNGRMMSPQEVILDELNEAGVDITNYFEVCAYYGINP